VAVVAAVVDDAADDEEGGKEVVSLTFLYEKNSNVSVVGRIQ
jgi:hypothetical protein